MSRSGSRSVGSGFAGSRSRNGCVTMYSCDIGTTGMRTPAIRPSSAENIPPAITIVSASMSPRSVRTRARLDAGHARAREDARAALARALRERERELRRVEVAVGREPRGAEHAVGRHEREQLLRLVGRDQVERQAERLRPARLAAQLLHALLARGEPDAAALDPAARLAELPVQLDRVHHHLREIHRAPQLAHEARGVERRARRELVALHAAPRRPSPARRGGRRSTCRRHLRRRSRSARRRGARAARPLPAGRLDPVLEARVAPRLLEAVEVLASRSPRSRSRARTRLPARRPTSPRGSPT